MTSDEIIVPTCQGCCTLIEEGAVVAFGASLFHVKCFICAKCGECVDNKTNLILLDDGRPVCDDCSYTCAACNRIIRDEAIMAGEKAYHSSCFKCVSCDKTIEDLIFTQTTKGFYCTVCNEIRKAAKSNKKYKTSESSKKHPNQPDQTRSAVKPPKLLLAPVRSQSNSSNMLVNSTCNSVLPDFTFSFFENDSDELANLSGTLGASLTLNDEKNTPQYRIKRASEILKSSLRTSSLYKPDIGTAAAASSSSSLASSALASASSSSAFIKNEEYIEIRSRLTELEENCKVLQDASQQALDEFTRLKDDFEREFTIKRQQELTIVSLMKKSGGLLSRKEIDKLVYSRVELERTCKELTHYRDKIATAIDDRVTSSPVYSIYQKSLKSQIKSLIQERDSLKLSTKDLTTCRDEIMHEMVLLNTKNAELTTMNNDLSRRAIEKEEATSTTLPTIMPSSNSPPLSPSQSTDTPFTTQPAQRPRNLSNASSVVLDLSSSRKSFLSDQTPTFFRLKKKTSAMFSKLGASSTASAFKSNKLDLPSPMSSSSSSSSSSSIFQTTSRSIYNNSNYSGSLQSLNYQDNSNTLGKSSKKCIQESSVSLFYVSLESHSFQPTSFLRPVKCGSCKEKIWSRSEYRCDGCGFSSHSRCLSKVPQQCFPATRNSSCDLNYSPSFENTPSPITPSVDSESKPLPQPLNKPISGSSMFGFDLSERVKAENRSVPLIVEECIKEVEIRGLDYEGIYRKSGGAAQIRAIQIVFDNGDNINLSDEDEYNDICAITSVLKQYFRELPNPLLTYEFYDQFIQISTMDPNEKKMEAFFNILQQLPKEHFDTIAMLFKHLVKVYEQSDVNRMSVKNLAMVFAPTLMRHSDASRDLLDISYKNAIIEYILLHTTELFSESSCTL